MIRPAYLIASKDLHLALGRGSGLIQALLLGLLLIFVFSLSRETGEIMTSQAAAAIFWMASAFCQVLIFSTLYAYEEGHGQRHGLLLMPAPVQSVWLGKGVAGLLLLLTAQCVFFPATIIFLGQELSPHWALGLGAVLLADLGIAILGSLLGALSQGQSTKESLLTIILFPLLLPLFLAGIRLGSAAFSTELTEGATSWIGIIIAFDGVFAAAALILFPYLYTAEE